MSVSRSIREISARGVKVTLGGIPIGRRPPIVEHQIHEPIHREILIQFLTRLLSWFNKLLDQDNENLDVNELNTFRKEIQAQINMLEQTRAGRS